MAFQTDTRLSRQRQITTLKVFNSTVEDVVEGSEYKVNFKTGGSLDLSLVVILPPKFPAGSPPLVFVKPPVRHPWVQVDDGRVIGAPGLMNFTHHSDLGMVVTAIRRELEKFDNLTLCRQMIGSCSPKPMDTSSTVSNDPVRSKLVGLSRDELNELLEKEEALDKFMLDLDYPPLTTMNENIRSMEENILTVAESNIAMQAEIETARDSLLCKVEEFHTRRTELGESLSKSQQYKARVSGEVLADKLVRLSVNNEELSDGIADRFLSKELSVDSFLADYISTRQKCHLQKFKADKVKHL